MSENTVERENKSLHLIPVLLIEASLFCIPFLANASDSLWHWVNDQGPSFLLFLVLGWGPWPMMAVVVFFYLRWLVMRND